MAKQAFVYIMTNKNNRVLYTGVTGDLMKRIYQHREGLCPGFTRKYNVIKLVYYEILDNIADAIAREKQIKGGPRQGKVDLIESMNPDWEDLYESLWSIH